MPDELDKVVPLYEILYSQWRNILADLPATLRSEMRYKTLQSFTYREVGELVAHILERQMRHLNPHAKD